MEQPESMSEPIPFPRAYTSRKVDGQLVPVEIARHRSHLDEVDDLMGNSDRSFVEKVRANHFEMLAGRHLAGRIGALSMQGDFTPNAVLDQAMREYDWIVNGNTLPVPGGVA